MLWVGVKQGVDGMLEQRLEHGLFGRLHRPTHTLLVSNGVRRVCFSTFMTAIADGFATGTFELDGFWAVVAHVSAR